MDFHLPQELYATSDYGFDEYEHEDDVFYRELRERVLQLTAEDDDVDDEEICENNNSNSVAAKQGLSNKCIHHSRGYYNWPENKEEHKSAPTWISNLWRNGKGTGVFIPQIVPSGRKNRKRKKGRKGRKSKVVENKDFN